MGQALTNRNQSEWRKGNTESKWNALSHEEAITPEIAPVILINGEGPFGAEPTLQYYLLDSAGNHEPANVQGQKTETRSARPQ
jgi:hypothetical protein